MRHNYPASLVVKIIIIIVVLEVWLHSVRGQLGGTPSLLQMHRFLINWDRVTPLFFSLVLRKT